MRGGGCGTLIVGWPLARVASQRACLAIRTFGTSQRRSLPQCDARVKRSVFLFSRHCSTLTSKLSAEEQISTTNNESSSTPSTSSKLVPSKSQLYMKLGKAQLTFGTAVMAGAGYLAVGHFHPFEFASVFLGSWILGMSGGCWRELKK